MTTATKTTAVAKIDGTPLGFKAFIENQKDRIGEVISTLMTPERVIKMALTAGARDSKLYNCTPASIVLALMAAAEVGLDCSGVTGKAYLIPFGRDAVFMPGYKGYIDIATRTGVAKKIEAWNIHENDFFEEERGDNPRITHKPAPLGKDPGERIGAYAIATLTNGEKISCVMRKDELDKVKKNAQARGGAVWKTWPEEMERKTAIRRLYKLMPSNPEIDKLLELEERVDSVMHQNATTYNVPPGGSATAALADAITVDKRKAEPEPEVTELSDNEIAFKALLPTALAAEWSEEDLQQAIESNGAENTAIELGAEWPVKD